MSQPHIRQAQPSDLADIARLAASQQQEPHRMTSYVSETMDEIRDELLDIDHWTRHACVALLEDRMVGALIGDTDSEVGRVWWIGPFIDTPSWPALASMLHDAASRTLLSTILTEEFAADRRHLELYDWATACGFRAGEASVTLAWRHPVMDSGVEGIINLGADTDADVRALHDRLFPGTYLPGSQLLSTCSKHRIRLVHRDRKGAVVGYGVAHRQLDGRGYIDYLGVAEHARHAGKGTLILRALVNRLIKLGCPSVHLTVSASNMGARKLYARVGFEESREIRGYRRSRNS